MPPDALGGFLFSQSSEKAYSYPLLILKKLRLLLIVTLIILYLLQIVSILKLKILNDYNGLALHIIKAS